MGYELIAIFFIIAAIYAAAGFGGGSSYLAAMSLFGLSMAVMKPSALLCNVVVVTGGTYIFWKTGHLSLKKIWPLVLCSVPLAFLGGAIPLREKTFFVLLGSSLVVASLLMLFQHRFSLSKRTAQAPIIRHYPIGLSALIGGSVGLLSGMVGIGGGIFLSPLLHLLRWDAPKNIAASASFFILVNSLAGLSGQLWQNKFQADWHFLLPLMAAVLVGGQIGSRLSALKFKQEQVVWATALLVFYAGANVLWQQLGGGW